jgi:hypothetical protein
MLATECLTRHQPVLEDSLAATEALLRDARAEGLTPGMLTPAELRLLQDLPSPLTYARIGQHLFISQNTVKTRALYVWGAAERTRTALANEATSVSVLAAHGLREYQPAARVAPLSTPTPGRATPDALRQVASALDDSRGPTRSNE